VTFAELKADLLRRLRETTPSVLVWVTDDDVEAALNDGYMELSDATEWCETWQTVDLLSRRPYYDLRTVLADTVLSIGPAFHVDTNRWLEPTTTQGLDARDPRWEQRIGVPDRLVMRGLWWLSYRPLVASAVGTVKQYFTALPAPLVEASDEPGFPVEFHRGLVDFATAEFLAQDGDTERALEAWAAYGRIELGLQAWVDARLAVPRVHGHA
jgi:hypothetical protein